MGKFFGTDGVRGIANKELTPELAFKLGKAGCEVLTEGSKKPTFVIGRDTRISGELLEDSMSAGILSVGGNVIKVGVIPTPAVAYLTRYLKADAGVVISASHNPFEYNGIKFFNCNGFKLSDSVEDKIEQLIENEDIDRNRAYGDEIGRIIHLEENPEELYINFLLETVEGMNLSGKKVVLDCANGASYKTAPEVYKRLGASVVTIGDKPDGVNINMNIGSTHPQKLQEAVKKERAFIGLAFDGDADRLIAVDENGDIIDGDRSICICARELKKDGNLKKNKVTVTVMSNIGVKKFVKEELGAETETTAVGDRYVLESMLETGSNLGGEQSGHIIFTDYNTTGDGTLSSLQLCRAIIDSGKSPATLSNEIKIYPQALVNASVKNENKDKFMDDDEVKNKIKDAEKELEECGRVLIRASGTEPLVRVMLEGDDTERLEFMATDIADLISKKFG